METIEIPDKKGKIFLIDREHGVYPRFTYDIRKRLGAKKALNIIVTGEAGSSKSYTAIQLAQNLDPNFDVELQVVYDYSEYMEALLKLPMYRPIVFDEPSYALSKREWYKELQQALVKTIESQRFLVKPLIIPIINQSLLDKTIRSYLIQYLVYCYDRGKAVVYTVKPSHQTDKIYYTRLCKLDYGLLDSDKCKLRSCLGCSRINACQLTRAMYERKKDRIQMSRYEQGKEQALEKESRDLTINQLVEVAYSLRDKYVDHEGHIDPKKLRVVLREDKAVRIGMNKSYDIRATLEHRYPSDFPSK